MKRLGEFLRDRGVPGGHGRPGGNTPPQQQHQSAPAPPPPNDGSTLNIKLENRSSSSAVYASITGRALDKNSALFLLQSDGRTPFLPSSPSGIGAPLSADCAIPLGGPGNSVTVTVPHLAGGRIYFSLDTPLTFLLNPGPALVEPSVTNPTDPNIDIHWGFAEFTFNTDQLYANISYVDFVGVPAALTLTTRAGATHTVAGMSADGLARVCDGLVAQHDRDGHGWDKLVVRARDGSLLRALSPNQGMVGDQALFAGYFEPYVEQAFARFAQSSRPLAVDTQAAFGTVRAAVARDKRTLEFGKKRFAAPSTRDIFSCSTGPFATGGDPEVNAIIPRLAAAFNRSTLLVATDFPADKSLYYRDGVTNHYARIVHEANVDGKGYAFPYDDVQPTGGPDQSGEVHAGDPLLFTVSIGGGGVSR